MGTRTLCRDADGSGVRGSAGVMAVVLAQAVAGGTTLLWSMPLWGEVKRGFFVLTGFVLLVLAVSLWWSATVGRVAGDDAGTWTVRLAAAAAVTIGVSTLLLAAKRAGAGHLAGALSAAVSISVLVAMAAAARQEYGLAVLQLLVGAAFLGSITDGLLLGHWYLTDRRLGRGPINRFTLAVIVSVLLEAVAVVSGGFTGTPGASSLNPLLTAGALAPWIALGMAGTTLLIAALTRAALTGSSSSAVQSATGFYYLGVVTSFTASVAFATRFLPG